VITRWQRAIRAMSGSSPPEAMTSALASLGLQLGARFKDGETIRAGPIDAAEAEIRSGVVH
jgi:hypothetical protein